MADSDFTAILVRVSHKEDAPEQAGCRQTYRIASTVSFLAIRIIKRQAVKWKTHKYMASISIPVSPIINDIK
ncbi:hypothetical protein [Xylanibacter muris]|uniref:Uncharacterized protein n=1 Tax=Xylanibacter muris TaxID=2736290 RepID=A0ABX2AMF3_9BACT|nr:hypothetical protein [Xylanibacter muris]NPD92374.1 hypothetical protein [Xylanibacter muris]